MRQKALPKTANEDSAAAPAGTMGLNAAPARARRRLEAAGVEACCGCGLSTRVLVRIQNYRGESTFGFTIYIKQVTETHKGRAEGTSHHTCGLQHQKNGRTPQTLMRLRSVRAR